MRGTPLSCAVVLLVLTAACTADPPDVAELPDDVGPVTTAPEVAVLDNAFDPDEVVVRSGTQVRWVWEGRDVHDVVGNGFESDRQAVGSFAHTFVEPGVYDYLCTLHPGMEATVLVTPADS